MMRKLVGLLGLSLLIGCSGGGSSAPEQPSAPFQFRSTADYDFAITVQRDGLPRSGASVSIVERFTAPVDSGDSEELAQGAIWYEGGSGDDGACGGVVALPTDVELVDVIVHDSDSVGPHTNVALRDRLGLFAPSSRVTVPVGDLASLTIDLEAR